MCIGDNCCSEQETCNSSQTGQNIGPRLLLMTNRKFHTRFRLVPKSMTLDDLEWPFALCLKMHAFSEDTTKTSVKIDPCYQRQRCSSMTLVSGNIRFMRIFARVPWRRGVKRQWCDRKVDFRAFGRYVFGTLGSECVVT